MFFCFFVFFKLNKKWIPNQCKWRAWYFSIITQTEAHETQIASSLWMTVTNSARSITRSVPVKCLSVPKDSASLSFRSSTFLLLIFRPLLHNPPLSLCAVIKSQAVVPRYLAATHTHQIRLFWELKELHTSVCSRSVIPKISVSQLSFNLPALLCTFHILCSWVRYPFGMDGWCSKLSF